MSAIIAENKKSTQFDLATGDIASTCCGAKTSPTTLAGQLLEPRMVQMGRPDISWDVGLHMPTTTTFRPTTMRKWECPLTLSGWMKFHCPICFTMQIRCKNYLITSRCSATAIMYHCMIRNNPTLEKLTTYGVRIFSCRSIY